MRALRRDRVETEEDFPRDVAELQRLLGPADPHARISATPGTHPHPHLAAGLQPVLGPVGGHRGLPSPLPREPSDPLFGVSRRLAVPPVCLAASPPWPMPYVTVGEPVVAAPKTQKPGVLGQQEPAARLGI